jgi:hypothetical protein
VGEVLQWSLREEEEEGGREGGEREEGVSSAFPLAFLFALGFFLSPAPEKTSCRPGPCSQGGGARTVFHFLPDLPDLPSVLVFFFFSFSPSFLFAFFFLFLLSFLGFAHFLFPPAVSFGYSLPNN